MTTLHSNRIRAIRRRLLVWFDTHQRDLPWRRTDDPYAIWVSEIMLQQTQVATVVDYYRRFMERFPSVADLAAAPRDDVLKHWEGLGYYSRARSLHDAARYLVASCDSQLPLTAEALQALPGIGPYTAGAIASIAFGQPEPVVDGNVARVLCRLCKIASPPKQTATSKRLWQIARDLLPPDRPGDFNQAIMELGALVCRPANPACHDCPLRTLCKARHANLQHDLPVRPPGKTVPHHTIVAAVIGRNDGRILIDRRREEAMLGGLWEFPGGKVEPGETLPQALRREVREEVDIDVEIGQKLCLVRHAYSHFRITLHAFGCRLIAGQARAVACDAVRWVKPDRLRRYAFPRANQKVLDVLAD